MKTVDNKSFKKLPRSIFERVTGKDSTVFIPYASNSNVAMTLAMLERKTILSDINPLTKILQEAYYNFPSAQGIEKRLRSIPIQEDIRAEPSTIETYFQPRVLQELLSIKDYLQKQEKKDAIDQWISCVLTQNMVLNAKNTLAAPNNEIEGEYVELVSFIIKEFRKIFSDIDPLKMLILRQYRPVFRTETLRDSHKALQGNTFPLICYAPPFFDLKKYYEDNLLCLWFNNVSRETLDNMMPRNMDGWNERAVIDFRILNSMLDNRGHIMLEASKEQLGVAFLEQAKKAKFEQTTAVSNQSGNILVLLRKP